MYLYGASGHGKVIVEIAEGNDVVINAFIDNDVSKTQLLGYDVIHQIPDGSINLVISIGNNNIRKQIALQYDWVTFETLIHSKSTISKTAEIKEGTVVMAGTTINAGVKIGKHCIVNTNSSVDHDCIVEDFAHIAPNAALAGNVYIGEGTHVGIGACVIQGVKIGKWCTVGAGTVVIENIPDGSTVVGNPGKIIKKMTI